MSTMPVIFFGHGNPMNALDDNAYTRAWSTPDGGWAGRKPCSRSRRTGTSRNDGDVRRASQDDPRFRRFSEESLRGRLSRARDPALAARVAAALAPAVVTPDLRWGLDHGTWSVLAHVFPEADVPVVQLSIDETQPPEYHYALGKSLSALRDEGVLIVGSGNLVHNLEAYAWGGIRPSRSIGPRDSKRARVLSSPPGTTDRSWTTRCSERTRS